MPDQTIDPRLVEQTRQHIRQLVAEINQLAGSDIPPQQFFGEFLQRVVAAVAGVGGAVWSRDTPQQPPRLQHQVNFLMSGLLDEASGAGGHTPLLMHAFGNGDAKLIPPHSGSGAGAERDAGTNSSDFALLISPLQVDKQTVGVVELLLDPTRRPTALENAVRFVQELCDIGAGYLKNRQLRQMLGQQHLWSQLESFVRQIHSSLTPKEVAYIVANEGKRMVSCDRLSVALVYGRKAVIEGMSGQEVIERKSTLVQLMTHLVNTVVRSNENLLYTGELEEDLPPAVRDSLDEYLAESGSKVLAIALLKKPNAEGAPGETIGALLGEQLEDATAPEDLMPRMEVVGQHGTIALANAMAHHRVFMLPVWETVGNATEWMRGSRLAKVAIAVGGIGAVTAAMFLVPLELRMQGRGTFVPENRRPVYAEEDMSVVTHVLVDHGQKVKSGNLLIEMKNDQLALQRENLLKEREGADANRMAAESTIREEKRAGRAPSPQLQAQALVAENDAKSFDRALQLVLKRMESNRVVSPIDGMIATWEPKRTLYGRPVKRGDPLLTIAQVEGLDSDGKEARWVLEVKMPEHKIGHILEADSKRRERGDTEPLTAWFILASHPQREFRAHVEQIATTAEFDQDQKEHIVMIRVVPDDVTRVHVESTVDEQNKDIEKVTDVWMEFKNGPPLKVSPDAEVRAKVDCGKRSMGFVLLRELIEFVYETVIF